MKKSLAVTLVLVFAATSSYAQSRRGHSGGGHGGRGHGGDRAVPRGHGSGGGYSGAAVRHPNPGSGYSHGGRHGSYGRGYGSYGRGHGYYGGGRGYYGGGHGYYGGGHGYYGRGYYGRGYGYYGRGYGYYGRGYGYYPYYGYPYYGYGYPWSYGLGLGIGLSFGSGYVNAGYVDAGYGASFAVEAPRVSESRQGEPSEEYVERAERGNGTGAETAELRLVVVGPEDASVYVDNEFRGIASRLVSVRVMAGTHRVEVVRPGYAVAQREVHVGRGATASLQIDLQRH